VANHQASWGVPVDFSTVMREHVRRWLGVAPSPELMSEFLAIGGDAQRALESVTVPSYALDSTGIVRWINPAAEQLLGDVRGRHFTSVVAPEDRPRARELFSRKLLGTAPATDAPVRRRGQALVGRVAPTRASLPTPTPTALQRWGATWSRAGLAIGD
jgi:PAS domain S-box-containing protein